MAKKKGAKKKSGAKPKPKAGPKPDSKDTVKVTEQVEVIKATSEEKTLKAIEAADNRPTVVEALKARREQIKKIEEPVKEDKFPDKELAKIEDELLAPVAEANVEASPPEATLEVTVEEPVAVKEEPEEPAPKAEPVAPLAGGVVGTLSGEAEDKQEIACQKAGDAAPAEAEAKLKNAKVAAAHAREQADKVMAEAKRLAEVATAAEAKAAREEGKDKPKPEKKVETKAREEKPVDEKPAAASSPPNALL